MVDSLSHLASALESAKSITKEAAAVVSSKLGESSYTQYSQSLSSDQLSAYLNSRNNREVKDAMKRIISVIASGDASLDVEYFFADVLKNVTSSDFKVKRLVYIYLLRYAERNPELALLSVNSIQKLLNDSDPELRCFAIKALTDIKIQSLVPILMLSLKKAVSDPSPLVRAEVAYGLLKLYRWQTSTNKDSGDYMETIELLLLDLLSDAEPRVISATIILFQNAFASKLELLHGHFRYYCKIIKQLDEWSHPSLVQLLTRYCKKFIPSPLVLDPSTNTKQPLSIEIASSSSLQDIETDADLSLFLQSLLPLRYSPNPLVIISCCNAFYQLSIISKLKESRFPEALFRSYAVTETEGVKITILQSILLFCHIDKTIFENNISDFFLLPDDQGQVASYKLQIIGKLVNEHNVKQILHELKYYILHSSVESIVVTSVDMLTSLAQISVGLENHILKWLVQVMESTTLSPNILDCFIIVIRRLIIINPLKHMKILLKLVDLLETRPDLADNARAGLIWLFGEMTMVEFRICPDILRNLVPSFSNENVESRNAILLFAAKLLSCEIDRKIQLEGNFNSDESLISKMYNEIIYLAKFDDDYDIRDRARFIASIFDSSKYEIATLLFQAPKPIANFDVVKDSSNINEKNHLIESSVRGYFDYIPWNEDLNIEEGVDIREPLPLKDYNRFEKSISSTFFISKNNMSRSFNSNGTKFGDSSSMNNQFTTRDNGNMRLSSTMPKYRLQSLDEFFSDIPEQDNIRKSNPKRTVIVEEDSSSEEETTSEEITSEDEEVDSEEEDTTLETSSDDTNSSNSVI